MIEYTKAAANKIYHDLKLLSRALNILAQVFSIFYLSYTTVTGHGLLAVNLILLAISVAYLIFYCATLQADKKNKRLKSSVWTAFKWSKRLVKLVNLGVAIYAYCGAKEKTMLNLLFLLISVGLWLLDLLLELTVRLVKYWGSLLKEGIEADIEAMKAPVTNAGNFFKRLVGKEVPPPPEPSKKRKLLEKWKEKGAQVREEKKRAKRAEKLSKKAKKTEVAFSEAPPQKEE